MKQIDQKHDWLSLISSSGLLISEPVLDFEFISGLKPLSDFKFMKFKKELIRFENNYKKGSSDATRHWLDFIFEELLGIDSTYWKKHNDIPPELIIELNEYNQTLKPSRVLYDLGKPILLVLSYPPEQQIDKQENKTGRWKASPFVKLDRLLRDNQIQLGIVTNCNDFRLIYAAPGLPTSYLTWNAQSWADEKITIDSFINLLNYERIFGKNIRKLIELIEESQRRQVEVTNQLGMQVRDALEILIKAMSNADKATDGKLLANYDGDKLYHMTLNVLMRLVFLLYAEENFLLPQGHLMYDRSYGITHLLIKLLQDERKSDRFLDENYDAWNRILSTFRLIHGGSSHRDLLMDGYGGDLFNPAKFPILEHHDFKISNRDIFEILRKLTFAQSKMGKTTVAQRLSYRSLDVEQIGSIYENLIDYTIKRATEDLIVFKTQNEDVIPLSELQNLSNNELEKYLSEITNKKIEKTKLENDFINLEKQISGFVKIKIKQNDLYLDHKKGGRKESGSFYTPKEVTSFLVQRAVENLVYNKSDSVLYIKSPKEILDLNICDPAMGSGAFLVQACRYLAERLVESWDKLLVDSSVALTSPYGEPSSGKIDEEMLPAERDAAFVLAKRLVAERCLHGVDINPLSVELAKMSLWLTTLSKNKPFSFLDHHLKIGNSLIGCSTEFVGKYPIEAWNRTFTNADENEMGKKIQRSIMQQKKSLDSKQSFLFHPTEVIENVEQSVILRLKEIDKISVFEPDKKELVYSKFNSSNEVQGVKRMLDGWTSIWFWQISIDTKDQPPLIDSYNDFLNHLYSFNLAADSKYKFWNEIVSKISEENKFFHWQLEFPDIFFKDNPGFDAIIGNPPWDKVKPDDDDFFSQYYHGFRKMKNKTEKNKIKTKILNDTLIKNQFDRYQNEIKDKVMFYKLSNLYVKRGSGDIDLWKLFLEKIFHLMAKQGTCSMVLPSGIINNEGGTDLRIALLDKNIINFYEFENRYGIFPDVHRSYKFIFITFDNSSTSEEFEAAFYLHDLKSLTNKKTEEVKFVKISKDLIKLVSPNSFLIPEVRNQKEIDIIKKIYRLHPPLFEGIEDGKWTFKFVTEMHRTAASHLFRTDGKGWPLIEGKHFHQFIPDYEKPAFTINPNDGLTWTSKVREYENKNELIHNTHRLVFREVASSTNVRSMISCIIPKHSFTTNKVFVVIPRLKNKLTFDLEYHKIILYLLGIFNSFIYDFLVRMCISTTLSTFIIYQIPVPSPNNYFERIIQLSERLNLIGDQYDDFIGLPKINNPPLEIEDRIEMIAELNALVAYSYGLKKDEYEHILKSFKGFKEDKNIVQNKILNDDFIRKLNGEIRKRTLKYYDEINRNN